MTSSPRPALGRGLSSLIPKTGAGAGVETVDIDLIVPNPHQPRSQFDSEALQELAQSIREHGVLAAGRRDADALRPGADDVPAHRGRAAAAGGAHGGHARACRS